MLVCSHLGVGMIRRSKRYAQSKRSEDILQVCQRLGIEAPGEVQLLLALLKRAVDDLNHPKPNVRQDAEWFLFNNNPEEEDLGLENLCELLDLRVEYARRLLRRQADRDEEEDAA